MNKNLKAVNLLLDMMYSKDISQSIFEVDSISTNSFISTNNTSNNSDTLKDIPDTGIKLLIRKAIDSGLQKYLNDKAFVNIDVDKDTGIKVDHVHNNTPYFKKDLFVANVFFKSIENTDIDNIFNLIDFIKIDICAIDPDKIKVLGMYDDHKLDWADDTTTGTSVVDKDNNIKLPVLKFQITINS